MSTISRCSIPVKISVLIIVPIIIAPTKNCIIASITLFERGFDVDKMSGKTSNGAFIRISLKAYVKSEV